MEGLCLIFICHNLSGATSKVQLPIIPVRSTSKQWHSEKKEERFRKIFPGLMWEEKKIVDV